MKVRNGFVSNSSSSSFALWGIELQITSLNDLLGDGNYFGEEKIDQICSDNHIGYVWAGDDGFVIIGLNPTDLNDDETVVQFKERIARGISGVLGRPVALEEIEWHEGTLYD